MSSVHNEKSGFTENERSQEHAMTEAETNELELKPTTTIVEGTTKLYDINGRLRCIPMPTPDPRDPLNLPGWRKFMAVLALCCYGSIALAAQQILGSLLPVFVFEYAGLDPNLITNGPPAGGGGPPGAFPGAGSPSGMPGGFPGGTIPSGIPSGFPSGAVPSGVSGLPNSEFGGIPSGATGIPTGLTISPTALSAVSPATPTGIEPNALASLANIPNAPPLWKVNLLSSLPVLIVGLANYILVPLSIVFGRRPVMIVCGLVAWVACIWAGKTRTLNEHLAARSIQALGAGAIESLVPLIVQDMSFIHQRNRAIGIIWASQAVVTLSVGIGSSHIVSNLGWRWLYFILAILGAASWLLIIVFVPETRWKRTPRELRGESDDCPPGLFRPALDFEKYGPRTMKDNLGVFSGGVRWADGVIASKEIAVSLFFPNVFLVILLNSAFIGIVLASAQTTAPVLLAPPYSWPFDSIGLIVIAIVIASIFVYIIGGDGADRFSNWITKRRGGNREPEVHLYNFIFPLFTGILGCILFGVGGSYSHKVHWMTLIFGVGFLNFAFLTINIVGSVYCVECFPACAGPVLVNVASFRNILGFGISFGVTDWVTARGYLGCFAIFAGVIAVLSLSVPILLIFGKRLRKRSGKQIKQLHTE